MSFLTLLPVACMCITQYEDWFSYILRCNDSQFLPHPFLSLSFPISLQLSFFSHLVFHCMKLLLRSFLLTHLSGIWRVFPTSCGMQVQQERPSQIPTGISRSGSNTKDKCKFRGLNRRIFPVDLFLSAIIKHYYSQWVVAASIARVSTLKIQIVLLDANIKMVYKSTNNVISYLNLLTCQE